MQKIIPCLWFDKNGEEAANFYVSVFKNSKVGEVTHYLEAGKEIHKMEPGSVLTVDFEIEGYKLMALNGGPVFKFTPAISFMVSCSSKEEVDELWNKLSVGGRMLMPLDTYPFSERYGWTEDKYGVSWQLIYNNQPSEQKIFPSLLFVGDKAGKAEEAINFYTSLFEDSKVGDIARYPAGSERDREGTVMYGDFTLFGQKFAAMDSGHPGHGFTFNEAMSLTINCKTQEEIDRFWNALSADPASEVCGWLKDKYGVSWQIAPEGMNEMLNDPDKEKANRAMAAMMGMKKIDIAEIQRAFEGK